MNGGKGNEGKNSDFVLQCAAHIEVSLNTNTAFSVTLVPWKL